jgi:hypothetical protein
MVARICLPYRAAYPIYTEKGSVGVTLNIKFKKMKDENDKDSSYYSVISDLFIFWIYRQKIDRRFSRKK